MPNHHTRFELPALPFERHALEPAVSRAQIDLLYSHYHRGQLDALNGGVSAHDSRSLAALARGHDANLRHHAAEAWNLVFFWHGLVARPTPAPEKLLARITRDFGGLQALGLQWQVRITAEKKGWSWLAIAPDGKLKLLATPAGQLPDASVAPLLAIALAPDAYRIDFGQNPDAWFEALWPHLNWEYAALHFELSGA